MFKKLILVQGILLALQTLLYFGFSTEFMMVLLCRILVSVGAVVIKYQLNQKKK